MKYVVEAEWVECRARLETTWDLVFHGYFLGRVWKSKLRKTYEFLGRHYKTLERAQLAAEKAAGLERVEE